MENKYQEIENILEEIRKENNQLLELCMFALIRDTKIYICELDNVTKLKLMATIKNNLKNDTYTLRRKLIEVWEEGKQFPKN